jgi:hypothetical protein
MTDLSPAARAVLNAAMQHEINPECYSREIAVAALRAAVDQVVPLYSCNTSATRGQTRLGVRHKLLALADELDNNATH